MAPALMNGLRGRPFSCSSWTIELNELPEGSRPTPLQTASPSLPSAKARVNTFDTLWIENPVAASPADSTRPSGSATAMPNSLGSTLASSGM